MKKIAFILLLSFNTICSYASPDRIGDEGNGSSFLDTVGLIVMCIMGLPIAFYVTKEWFSGNMKDDNSMGCAAVAVIVSFILFVVIKCS